MAGTRRICAAEVFVGFCCLRQNEDENSEEVKRIREQ